MDRAGMIRDERSGNKEGEGGGKLANPLLPTLDRLRPRKAGGGSDKIDYGLRGDFRPPRYCLRIRRTLRRSFDFPGSSIVMTISVYSGASKKA